MLSRRPREPHQSEGSAEGKGSGKARERVLVRVRACVCEDYLGTKRGAEKNELAKPGVDRKVG
jgi:hypothetical protein